MVYPTTDERLAALEAHHEDLARRVNGNLERMYVKLDDLDRKLSGRPSWTVATAIGVLTTGFAALGTYVLTTIA